MNEVVPALSAGIISTLICNPLDTLRVNYQLNRRLYYDIGFLYRGIKYGILTIPSFWVIYFPMYKTLNQEIKSPLAAYISCCTASTITSPLWALRQASQTNKKLENSFKNLYRGLIPTYFVNLNFTIQIPLYEYIKTKLENNTINTFFAVAVSKTFASVMFYPFDTIRTRIRDGKHILFSKRINYYKGISIYIARSLPYHVSIFCTYEYIKRFFP
jgi:hypothetical protein|tara:strand:- start:21 stop:665 length:645 start_codon:yes stop_codon:yes gene_type:complete